MIDFETLYGWVKDLPIIDWHNHLDMKMLAEDRPLGSLYEVWVRSDPYKHRAMRICGEPERLITGGNGQDVRCPSGGVGNGRDVRCPSGVPAVVEEPDKWAAWMRSLPKLVGNPLFAWARMELEWLGLDAEQYLHGKGENISLSAWTPSKMLKRFCVEYLSPCVSPSQLSALEGTVLGQRTSRPLEGRDQSFFSTDRMSVVPVAWTSSATDKMSVVPVWTAPEVKDFPAAHAMLSGHFSHALQTGEFHRRNLPHLGQTSVLVFLTFRLADSLPQSRLDVLAAFRGEWNRTHPEPWSEAVRQEWAAKQFDKIDKWLDAGHGSCMLADARLRKVVEDALEYFNAVNSTGTTDVPSVGGNAPVRSRYRLHSYVVMPNHVHVLMELFDGKDLPKIVQGWKAYTAKEINRLTGRSGAVWMAEYYDRLIRNAEHYANTLRYIQSNGEVARRLAESNGRDVRCPSGGSVNGQDVRCPSGGSVNGQDVRCPRIVPSLRMNAGDEVSEETLEKFHAVGCRVVDVSVDDVAQLATPSSQLSTVAAFAAAHGWTMLLHLGAFRETSARLRAAAGPVGGFAGMRTPVDPVAVASFLNGLEVGSAGGTGTTDVPSVEKEDIHLLRNGQDVRCPSGLPRTILLTLNPEAHAQLAVLAGSFNGEGMPGKVQLGPAWWWCDHEEGIRDVLEKTAAYGVLSTFVGMTTDSRSLLSFVRHDYFRRILCRWTAEKVASGAFPGDESMLRPMLENVCCGNARKIVSPEMV